ncbi:MAG: peptidyl-prolyl cis-trans isomerase, partial [Candidatus Omnitrophica bacterium]|nr:peptidyl-prolyl cis-trans isomerase [Candidatus Omnitrophota bacterium]
NLKFADAGAKLKQAVKTSEPFVRNNYVQGIGLTSELGDAAFTTKPGELAPLARTRGGFCIYAVSEIIPADMQKFEKEKEEFGKKAFEAKKIKTLNDWYLDLLKRADLKNNVPQE